MPPEFIDNFTGNDSGNTNSVSVSSTTKIPLEEILELTIQILIAFIGATGNVAVVIVISKLGKKKKTTDFYVQNLAIADLGILILTYPLSAIKQNAPFNWPLGEFVCLYFSPVPEIFHGASVWFIAVIGMERYGKILAVGSHGENRNKAPTRKATIFAACVWVMSFLIFSLPLYFMLQYRELPEGGTWCGPLVSSLVLGRVYMGLLTFLSYIFPLIIISFTYLQISRAINRSCMFFKATTREQQNLAEIKQLNYNSNVRSLRLKRNKRIKEILTPVVLVFAITMLALSILRIAIVTWPAIAEQEYYENLMVAVSVFVILNSSANPVIYFVVSSVFRKETKNLFCLVQA